MPIPSGPFPHEKRHLLPGMVAVRRDGRAFVIDAYFPAAGDFPAFVTSSGNGIAYMDGNEDPIASVWTGEGDPSQRTMMWRR